METFDVVVIGAGLAGLQLAHLLAEQGFRILLVDRKPSLDQSVHTTGIFVRRTLEDFPLPEDCLGPPVRTVKLYSPARRALTLVSPHDEFRVGRMRRLYQSFLHKCICAGVEWMPATRFREHYRFRSETIVLLETESSRRWVRTRYLVGADGAVSAVGAALGLDENREWIVGVEEVFEGVPLDGPPRFDCFLDPRLAPGYLGWVVHDGEEVHIGVGGYPNRFEPVKGLREFREGLNGIVDLSEADLVERRGGRIPVGGVLKRIANESGLLVGDAAGAVSPLTAGGLDPCMRLSTIAAKVISNYLVSGDPRALETYSGELFRTRFISRLWMRRMIASIQSQLLIEIGCALLRQPILDSLAWHVFFGRGSFPDVNDKELCAPVVEDAVRL
jgi:flavin-dependent dehydrogenase